MAHSHDQSPAKGITLAFWLNLLFSIIELFGGFLTNSAAIIADAFHDFMDAVAIGTAVLLEKLSRKKRSATFTYGYGRFSLLSALCMSVLLLVGAVVMCYSAYQSFLQPKEVNSSGMLWLAVLGVCINGFAFLKIKKSNGTHTHHGHNHSHNSKAIMLHLLEDVLGWIAVLIGVVIIYYTKWYWIDGVLTVAIAIFIAYNASKNLIQTLKILLQSAPSNVDLIGLSADLKNIKGVENIHDLHVWTLDGNYNIGSLHAVVPYSDNADTATILEAILKTMNAYHIQHPTIQIESAGQACHLQKS